jgi:NAD(P)-dependent dehydrogenase (short-subunit alcohol dehydrogenase family)
MRLKNRIALITGGTFGIGEATAVLFACEGAKVAITGRSEERGREDREGGKAIFVRTDARKAVDCRHAVDETAGFRWSRHFIQQCWSVFIRTLFSTARDCEGGTVSGIG